MDMRLLLVGDVMIGRLVNAVLTRQPPEYPWGSAISLFRDCDLRICNLECVLSDKGKPWSATPKVFHFRSDAKNLAVLKAAGIDMVSLANNHALDYEYEALLECLDLLEGAGIRAAGAGRNREEAQRPAIIEACGVKVGLLAFTDNEPEWEATEHRPGTFYVPVDEPDERRALLLERVARAKRETDFLVVSAHWGPNWGYAAPRPHVQLAHELIDAGACVVYGHSAHVFRGVELYRGRPILYSTGDFVDDYAVDPVERNDESFGFVLQVEDAKVMELNLYPTVIANCQARHAPAGLAPAIADKMQMLCAGLGTVASWISEESFLRIPLRGA